MDIKTINNQLELVQACYEKVALAQADWNKYRRIAGAHNQPTPDRPEFRILGAELTHTAEELAKRREAVSNALCGVGIVQVEICSEDAKRIRRAVISRPDARIANPYISHAAYHALALMLGEPMYTTAPFDIAVTDDFGRVSNKVIRSKSTL